MDNMRYLYAEHKKLSIDFGKNIGAEMMWMQFGKSYKIYQKSLNRNFIVQLFPRGVQ